MTTCYVHQPHYNVTTDWVICDRCMDWKTVIAIKIRYTILTVLSIFRMWSVPANCVLMHCNCRTTCSDCDHRLWGWYTYHCSHIQSTPSQTSCCHNERIRKGSRSSPGLPWRVSQLFTWLKHKNITHKAKISTEFFIAILNKIIILNKRKRKNICAF